MNEYVAQQLECIAQRIRAGEVVDMTVTYEPKADSPPGYNRVTFTFPVRVVVAQGADW